MNKYITPNESYMTTPAYPIILDWNGFLISIRDEFDLKPRISSCKLTPYKEYLMIDSKGTSWCILNGMDKENRIFTSEVLPKLTKKKFVNGFNARKNAINKNVYKVKLNHHLFIEIFSQIYKILEEEREIAEDIEFYKNQNENNSASKEDSSTL